MHVEKSPLIGAFFCLKIEYEFGAALAQFTIRSLKHDAMLSCHRSFEPTARLSTPNESNGHRTNRLSDCRFAITFSRISSGSIDMPPSGVTRRDFRLLRAAMNARSLACSVPGLLSLKKRAMHRSNIFIPRSVGHEPWNASSSKGRKMSWFFSTSLSCGLGG